MILRKYLRIQIIIILSLLLTGCLSLKKENPEMSVNEIYEVIQKKLQDDNWRQAITPLENLYNRYPLSPYLQQIQLDLIYVYYKNSDFLKAKSIIDHFMRFNSTHPNIDYILYMYGIINIELDNNTLQNFFRVDRSDCNPKYAINALNSFSKLVHDYPESQYVVDAKKYICNLEERIAKYEYSIAEYYNQHGAWIAVINRVKNIIKNYPNTQEAQNGLKLIQNAYHQIQNKYQDSDNKINN